MKIPVFVSIPSKMSPSQLRVRKSLFDLLDLYQLEPRTLGQSDYPTQMPLREVVGIARRCAGALICGFEQHFAATVEVRRGYPHSKKEDGTAKGVRYPTPWNHLEAGIIYTLGLPLLVFREQGVAGGIFDPGVTEAFVHEMPTLDRKGKLPWGITDVFLKWQGKVREEYYRF
jgi:hypothetical protein